jgi:hypothetical protein
MDLGGKLGDQAELMQLLESLPHLRQESAACHGQNDVVGRAPAQLLGDLEGTGLRSFRVVRPEVHVDKGPTSLGRYLGAEPVHLVISALH